MKHAGAQALERLEPLLARLRALDGIAESGRGIFYAGRVAFLHFHEQGPALFCDLRRRPGAAFERLPASGPQAQHRLLAAADEAAAAFAQAGGGSSMAPATQAGGGSSMAPATQAGGDSSMAPATQAGGAGNRDRARRRGRS